MQDFRIAFHLMNKILIISFKGYKEIKFSDVTQYWKFFIKMKEQYIIWEYKAENNIDSDFCTKGAYVKYIKNRVNFIFIIF